MTQDADKKAAENAKSGQADGKGEKTSNASAASAANAQSNRTKHSTAKKPQTMIDLKAETVATKEGSQSAASTASATASDPKADNKPVKSMASLGNELKANTAKANETKANELKKDDKSTKPTADKSIPSTKSDAKSAEAKKPSTTTKTNAKPSTAPKTSSAKPEAKAKVDDKAKASQSASAQKSEEKSGFGGKLAAGLVGGVIALGGWAGLQYSNILPPIQSAMQPASQTDSQSGQTANSAADVEKAIHGVEESLNQKIAQLEAQIKANTDAQASDGGGSGAGVSAEAFEAKIVELEQNITVLDEKLTQAQAEIQAEAQANTSGELNEATKTSLAEMGEQVTALSKVVSDIKPVDVAPFIEPLDAKIQGLQKKLDETTGANQAIVERIDGLEKTLQDEGPEQKAAKVLAASQLQSQISSGNAYADTLKRYKQITGDAESFASLEPHAQNGIPTLSQLHQQFDGVSDAVITALEPKAEEGDMFGQLLQSAKSLVKVKPVEGQEGTAPTAILGRIQSHLKQGKLDGVLREWQNLPPEGQQAGEAWIKAVEMRKTANGILDTVLDNMMTN